MTTIDEGGGDEVHGGSEGVAITWSAAGGDTLGAASNMENA